MERLISLPGIPRFRSLKNELLYPSTQSFIDATKLSAVASGALVIAMTKGLPKKYGVMGLVSAWVPEAIQLYREDTSAFRVNNLFILSKTSSPETKKIDEFRSIKRGEMLGEIHLFGMDQMSHWENLSKRERGKRMAFASMSGLEYIATMCEEDDILMRDLSVFHGRSDLVRPVVMEELGFVVEKGVPGHAKNITRNAIVFSRSGFSDQQLNNPTQEQIHDVWITREALIKALPKIQNYREYFQKGLTSEALQEIAV